MSPIQAYLSAPGAMQKLADACGVTHAAVWQWWRNNRVPPERVLQVEKFTGIPRSTLRPDLYPVEPSPEAA